MGRREKKLAEEIVDVSLWLSRHRATVAAVLLVAAVIIGTYIRMAPAISAGKVELNAYDPWIEYWLSKQLYQRGLSTWFELTRANPDTRIFWYPWGRDFAYDEFVAVPLYTAASYKLVSWTGLTLREWTALQPVFAGALAIIAAFLLGRELTGMTGGVIAAFSIATLPGAADRTIVGFVEKEGIAMPFLILLAFFYVRMLKRKNFWDAVLAGVMMGVVGLTWGGVYYAIFLVAGHMALMPLLNYEFSSRDAFLYASLIVAAAVILVFSPEFLVSKPFLWIGILVAAYIAMLLGFRLSVLEYLVLIAVVATGIIVLAYMGMMPFGGRILKALGVAPSKVPPLVQSVAEHQGARIVDMFNQLTGLALFVALGYAIYVLFKRDPYHSLIGLAALSALYAYKNMAYFAQLASLYTALSVGLLVGIVASKGSPEAAAPPKKRRRRVFKPRVTETFYLAVLLLIVVGANIAYAGVEAYNKESKNLPQIMTSGIGIAKKNHAWLDAMNYVRTRTPSSSVIVSWWDYGYWISVIGERGSVADGATLNSTQIKILAKILTANETEASRLMYSLGLVPNQTYVLVYDVFVAEYNTTSGWGRVSPYPRGLGMVDLRKIVWMLRIGERIPLTPAEIKSERQLRLLEPYMAPYKDQQGRITNIGVNFTNNANMLLVGLMVHGIYNLAEYGIGNAVVPNVTRYYFIAPYPGGTTDKFTLILPYPYKHFKPEKIFTDTIEEIGDNARLFVAIFLYKWLG